MASAQQTDHSSIEHNIVCLEEAHCPIPKFAIPNKYTSYAATKREEVASRLRDATIAIVTIVPVTVEDLDQCPRLKCVYVMATGCELVDREGFAQRGVTVIRAPQSNLTTVSEHALALYFAARRRVCRHP